MMITYAIHEVAPYINWIYFFHAWGFQPRFSAIANIHGCDACRASWLTTFEEGDRAKAAEAMQLYKEAHRMLNMLDADYRTKAKFRLCKANSDGDDIVMDDVRFPFLRQQHKRSSDGPNLCLSDFVRPVSSGVDDMVGVFASTVEPEMEQLYADDPYKRMLVQTLADRLAEATAEKVHEYVRKVAWAYAPEEKLQMTDLLHEKYQGIRPAVGYPSMPDQSVNFIIDQLLNFGEMGITLTANGMMIPHASVSGLMFAHPQAHYFAVGKIGEDQLSDYSGRRGVSAGEMRKFLAANL